MTKTYTTVQGDTWDGVAKKTLGSEYLMAEMIDANLLHAETVIFSAGVVLSVPEQPVASALNLPPWKRG